LHKPLFPRDVVVRDGWVQVDLALIRLGRCYGGA